jgi:IS605 OrfB family transposase
MPKRKREEFLLWDAIFPKLKEFDMEKKKKTDSWYSKNTMIETAPNECERFNYEGRQDHVESSKRKKMKKGNNDIFSMIKTRKVGLRPTKQQVITIETLFRGANHAYNLCVKLVNDHNIKPHNTHLDRIVSCQKKDKIKEEYREDNDEWYFKDVPSQVKSRAVKQFLTAFHQPNRNPKNAMKKKDVTNVFGTQAMYTEIPDDKHIRFYPNYLGKDGIETKSSLAKYKVEREIKSQSKKPDEKPKRYHFTADHDCNIYRSPTKKYYALIPISFTPKVCDEERKKMIVSIDPGARTFATLYDPVNLEVTEYCYDDDFDKNVRKHLHLADIYKKRMKKFLKLCGCDKREQLQASKNKKKYDSLHYRMLTENERKRNKIHDMHHKVAKELASTYGTIILGRLNVKSCIKGKTLSKQNKRKLVSLEHYRFRQFLQHKCMEYGTDFIDQEESWTSKTCSKCNTKNMKLKDSKTFHCVDSACGYTVDRDVNGARNIMRKFMGWFPDKKKT